MRLTTMYANDLERIADGDPTPIKKVQEEISRGRLTYLRYHGFTKYMIAKDVESLAKDLRAAIQDSYAVTLDKI